MKMFVVSIGDKVINAINIAIVYWLYLLLGKMSSWSLMRIKCNFSTHDYSTFKFYPWTADLAMYPRFLI